MSGSERRHYAALAASAISTVAWLAAGLLLLASLFTVVTGRTVEGFGTNQLGTATVAALVVGIGFARLEKRLYD